ncbi:MAG: LysM peptidoglycan-binding domain-containing protein [Verrucomicrobiota bacterium]
MSIFRTLTILLLTGVIFGGSAYFAYDLYWKPKKLDREDKIAKSVQVDPSPPPDYSLPAYKKAMMLRKSGAADAAGAALAEFLRAFPESPSLAAAKSALGEINAAQVFSPSASADKVAYAVAKGDSLAKIAAKFKTNAELVFRANNLDSINLQIGQQLFIPQLDTSLVVDRKAGTVTVLNRGEFFKEYPAGSITIHSGKAAIKTKVTDKLALQGSTRVAFGDKNYSACERWLMLGQSGLVIRSQPAADGPAPAGIILAPADMEEVFVLVSPGAPVTIK